MKKIFSKLLEGSEGPLSDESPSGYEKDFEKYNSIGTELFKLLSLKNGFFSFSRALHIFPVTKSEKVLSLKKWNSEELWISSYEGMADSYFFFAEDLFGGQFGVKENKIFYFEPETGEITFFSDSLESWANKLLDDIDFSTGFPLAREWIETNGVIPVNSRLLPKIPFVAGGGYCLDNLFLCDSAQGMKYRAEIALQIKDIPDGGEVSFETRD